MPSTLLRRQAIIPIAFLIGFLASDSLPLKAADPSASAHEAAVLDRIFANWKARHDRVRTLHFTIDSRIVYKSGGPIPPASIRKRGSTGINCSSKSGCKSGSTATIACVSSLRPHSRCHKQS
jgi:hypothetical protein